MSLVPKNRKKLWQKHKAQLIEKRSAYWDYVQTLVQVVDAGTWREEYETQEEFVKAEADISSQHFRRLRDACEVRQRIAPMGAVENVPERQLRELAKAPETEQAAIFAEVSEQAETEGRQPTAKDIKQAVKRVVAEVVDEPEPEKPDAWKIERSKCIKTVQALQRSIDDLNDLKRKPERHQRLVNGTRQFLELLEGWK